MFNSTVLEVAIGLCFTFASVALITSSVNEAFASIFKWRANTLLSGIQELLNDPNFNGLALKLYNHALTNPRGNGNATGLQNVSKPSYIPPQHFAQAFIDGLDGAGQDLQSIEAAIDKITDPQLKKLLQGFYQRADGKLEAFQTQLANWFDYGMERVSGVYKRKLQLWTFLIAMGIAALLNIDALSLFQNLWQHPSLVDSLKSTDTGMAALKVLPIGWSDLPNTFTVEGIVQVVRKDLTWSAPIGWLITASSALFGAPFWFDALQKITSLRSSGKKPTTNISR